MADFNTSLEVGPTFTCALTPQYSLTFDRAVHPSATIALCTINILFAITASILNLLVMVSIVSTPKLQTPTFILLCNLALTDFLVGLVIGCMEVVYLITRELGDYSVFCTNWKVLVVMSYFLCPASLYTITSISYDRYLSLQMKVKYKTVVTKKKACVTVVILWVCAGLGVTLIGILGKTPFLILVCCVTFFCLGVIIDCYLLCGAAIRRHQNEIMASTSVKKSKARRTSNTRQESLRANKGRRGIKRPIESFGQERDERKKLAKSRDIGTIAAIGQFETCDSYEDDDSVGQLGWMGYEENEELELRNTIFDDLELEEGDNKAIESEEESLPCHISIQKPINDSRKRRSTTSSTLGGKTQHTLAPSNLKYILVNKDIESVIEEVEIDAKHVKKAKLGENRNDEENVNEQKEKLDAQREANIQRTDNSRLTFQKAQLLVDIKKFKQTLHTILMIVVFLFLCYLPYMVVSTMVNLNMLHIGISWDLASMSIYLNSSISPIIMCTRISSIREACRRILRRTFSRQ